MRWLDLQTKQIEDDNFLHMRTSVSSNEVTEMVTKMEAGLVTYQHCSNANYAFQIISARSSERSDVMMNCGHLTNTDV